MNKLFKNISGFLLFSLLINFVFLIFWGELIPTYLNKNLLYKIDGTGFAKTKFNDVENYQNIDILFLGSSYAYRGFDTRIFKQNGFKSFNLGTSNQTPIQSEFLLKKYFNTLNPKIIIYAVSPSFTINEGVESALNFIATNKIDIQTFNMVLKINNLKTYVTFLYGLYRELFNRNYNFTEQLIKGDARYISGGYVETKIHHFNVNDFKSNVKEAKPLYYQIEAFKNIVAFSKSKNIELIFVQAPITGVYYDSYDQLNLNNQAVAFFSNYSEYYDFNKIISLDDSLHFSDRGHLNQLGVIQFNKALIYVINEKKINN